MMTADPTGPTKVLTPWTEARVLAAMQQSRKFVEHSILALFHQQSKEQQRSEDTDAKRDRVGFNRIDKPYLNEMANNILLSEEPEGHRLTDRQLFYAMVKLQKYAVQLANLANRRTAEELLTEARRQEVQRVANPCQVCFNAGIVVTDYLGVQIEEPCPRCGDTPMRG